MFNVQDGLQGIPEAVIGFPLLVLGVAVLAAHWKIFRKAGRRGWHCLIPVYGSYVFYSITWGNGWFFLIEYALTGAALATTGLTSWLILVCEMGFHFYHQYKTAKSFDQGIGFTVGLALLYPIFICILGFGNYKYIGPSGIAEPDPYDD